MPFPAGFQCAGCGEWNEIVVDESAGGRQQYVEDCQVCCKPNLLSVSWDSSVGEYYASSRIGELGPGPCMIGSKRRPAELGSIPSVTYNRLFLQQDPIFSSEGVPIFRVVSGSRRSRFSRTNLLCRFLLGPAGSWPCFYFAVPVLIAWAQQDVVTQIRVIGNRRIPRETVLARLFTHPGDAIRSGHDRARFQFAVEHGLLRKSADCPRRYAQGHRSRHHRQRKADDPRDQLQGPELGFDLRCSRPL